MPRQLCHSTLHVLLDAVGGAARSLMLVAAFGLAAARADAQTYGIATMQPGTLNHTTGSAIAKVLREKGGMNVLVQPTAGETTLIPMVDRAEAEMGIANIAEVVNATRGSGAGQQADLRLIGSIHPVRVAFFVRKDGDLKTIADLKGKRVNVGYSARRTVDAIVNSMLATAGLTQADVQPVPVPNVIRGADDFLGGAATPSCSRSGLPRSGKPTPPSAGSEPWRFRMPAWLRAARFSPYGYLTEVSPGPVFVGVPQKMKVYSYDNMLFTNAKVADDIVYKIMETMESNKAELVTVQPALREFSAANLYKQYDIPYHPGALKYFKDKGFQPKAIE